MRNAGDMFRSFKRNLERRQDLIDKISESNGSEGSIVDGLRSAAGLINQRAVDDMSIEMASSGFDLYCSMKYSPSEDLEYKIQYRFSFNMSGSRRDIVIVSARALDQNNRVIDLGDTSRGSFHPHCTSADGRNGWSSVCMGNMKSVILRYAHDLDFYNMIFSMKQVNDSYNPNDSYYQMLDVAENINSLPTNVLRHCQSR
jgi:hypothetical protein